MEFDFEHMSIYGLWGAVIFNVALFGLFVLSFLRPRGKWEWRSMGAFTAFLVALFTEMYGIPLTVYLLTSVLGSAYPVGEPFSHKNGHLWVLLSGGSTLAWQVIMIASNVLIFGSLGVMWKGWRQIYRAGGGLVTHGLYGLVRHPQYTALFILMVGFFIQWPTLVTAVMLPVLVAMYYRLARREEKGMEDRFGDDYAVYRQQVPMFFPRFTAAPQRLGVQKQNVP